MRAANTLGSAGYNHSRRRLSARLKQAFESGSASPEQQLRTTEFLERAARYQGTEYNVIRNMIAIDSARHGHQKRSNPTKKLAEDEEQLKNGLEYVMATYNVPGPNQYSEALKKGKLPTMPESTRALTDLIRYGSQTQYDEYDALIRGLNETMGLALPVDGQKTETARKTSDHR